MTTLSAPFSYAKRLAPRFRRAQIVLLLPPTLALAAVASIGSGGVEISPAQVVSILLSYVGAPPIAEYTELQANVLHAIRLPRVLLGGFVGAGLAVAGAAMQGLFRNPLADPGLLGISSGASLAAAGCTVLGVNFLGFMTLPAAAFVGSTLSTIVVYAIAQERGRISVTTMLLGGIAINAICGAGTGMFTFLASDDQLSAITSWQLGSLAGATWSSIQAAAPLIAICVLGMPFAAAALNAMLLGESNARHMGVHVDAVKWAVILLVALGVGASVAVSGMIGFVGLVVPHLIRLWIGPNHRVLLPASALLGALLLVLADLFARTIADPRAVPIGVVTALLGGPFFLFLLLRGRKTGKL